MLGIVILNLMSKHYFDTTYQLAKETGITQSGLKRILEGKVKKPHRKTYEKIAGAFGLTVVQLKKMEEDEAKNET